jgi:sulfur-oxidizing protein SoxZ
MDRPSIRLRTEWREGVCTLRVLIKHPMEPERVSESGERTPSHFIKELRFLHQGRELLTAYWGPGIARNPYLEFSFDDGSVGDELVIEWLDSRGERDRLDTRLDAAAG